MTVDEILESDRVKSQNNRKLGDVLVQSECLCKSVSVYPPCLLLREKAFWLIK